MSHEPTIPFLRPSLVTRDAYARYLQLMDEAHWYSNFGPLNARFEEGLLGRFFAGSGALTTVANATLGLMAAIRAVARPRASLAIMPSFTFAAAPLAAQWCGLTPYFVDCDPHGWCMATPAVQRAIDRFASDVAVVMPYAAFGAPMDLAPYARWHRSGIPCVVDAASSLGTQSGGSGFGTGFPGAVVFSLHATKAFGIGEGGVVYSGDEQLVARVRTLANFGLGADRASTMQGLNAKLSEIMAAVGLGALDVYDERAALRRASHARYRNFFSEVAATPSRWAVQALPPGSEDGVVRNLMPVLTPRGLRNTDVAAALATLGIQTRTYFSPACHRQPQFAACPGDPLPHTDELARRCLSLPLWDAMDAAMVDRVTDALLQVCEAMPAASPTT